MIVYRICGALYADDLSGTGSKMYGGRWNNKGIPLLYTSSTRALAALEVLVHIPSNIKLKDFSLISISIPDDNFQEINYKTIKNEIEQNGLNSNFKSIGDDWFKKNSSLILKVPSIIIKEEFNFLLNTLHKDFNKVKIIDKQSFSFDSRLLPK